MVFLFGKKYILISYKKEKINVPNKKEKKKKLRDENL
jgi:hypothetical protein